MSCLRLPERGVQGGGSIHRAGQPAWRGAGVLSGFVPSQPGLLGCARSAHTSCLYLELHEDRPLVLLCGHYQVPPMYHDLVCLPEGWL